MLGIRKMWSLALLAILAFLLWACGGPGEGFGEKSLAVSKASPVTPNASVSAHVLVEDCQSYEDPDGDDDDDSDEPPISDYDYRSAAAFRAGSAKGDTYVYCDGFEPVPLSLFPNDYIVKIVPKEAERVKRYSPGPSNPGEILQTILFGNPGPCPPNMNACTEIDLSALASPNFVAILAKTSDDPLEYEFTDGYTVLPPPFGVVGLPEVYPKAPEGGEELRVKVQVHLWELDDDGLVSAGVSPADVGRLNQMLERTLWEEKCHAELAKQFASQVGMIIDMLNGGRGRYASPKDAAAVVKGDYAKAFGDLYAEYERLDNTELHRLIALAEIDVPLDGFFKPDGTPVGVPVFGCQALEILDDYVGICGEPPGECEMYDDPDYPDKTEDDEYPPDYPGDDDDDEDGDTDEGYINPMCGDIGSEDYDYCPGSVANRDWPWVRSMDIEADDYTAEITCTAKYHWDGRPEDVGVPALETGTTVPMIPYPQKVDFRVEIITKAVWECDWGGDLTWKYSYYVEGYESESATAPGYSRSADYYLSDNGGSDLIEKNLSCDLQYSTNASDYTLKKDLVWYGGSTGWSGEESVSMHTTTADGSASDSRDLVLDEGHLVSDSRTTGSVERTSGGKLDLVNSRTEERSYEWEGYNYRVTSEMIETSLRDYQPFDSSSGNPGQRYVASSKSTLEMKSENVLDLKYTASEEAVEATSMKNGTLMYMGSRQVQNNVFDYEDQQRSFYRSTNYETFNSSNQALWTSGRPLTLYVVSSSIYPSESGRILANWGPDSNANWVTSEDCDDLKSEADKLSEVESGLYGGSGDEHYPTDGCQDGYW